MRWESLSGGNFVVLSWHANSEMNPEFQCTKMDAVKMLLPLILKNPILYPYKESQSGSATLDGRYENE